MIVSETHVSYVPESSQLGSVDSTALLQTPLEMKPELFLHFFPQEALRFGVNEQAGFFIYLRRRRQQYSPQLTDMQIIPSSLNCRVLE